MYYSLAHVEFWCYPTISNRRQVEEVDSRWECFLHLLEITKICTARITSPEQADYLRILILEHHTLFRSCYPVHGTLSKIVNKVRLIYGAN